MFGYASVKPVVLTDYTIVFLIFSMVFACMIMGPYARLCAAEKMAEKSHEVIGGSLKE